MNLDRYDVVTVPSGKSFTGATTFTVYEAAKSLGNFLQQKTNAPYLEWTQDGVECCALQVGGDGWVKGKVRISLEFIAHEEELGEVSPSVAVLKESPSNLQTDVFGGDSSEIQ